MSQGKPTGAPRKPAPSPYLLSLILFLMGIWFFYDGFLNEEFIEKHPDDATLKFNRYGAFVLFALAGIDFYRMRKAEQARAARRAQEAAGTAPASDSESG